MSDFVHVFAGKFSTHEEACLYSEAQWEPEPSEAATDEEYKAWEHRNPCWQLRYDLGGIYLNGDFIETVFGPQREEYLAQILTSPDSLNVIRAASPEGSNTLVLVFNEATGGFPAEMQSTPRVTYCGRFACDLARYR